MRNLVLLFWVAVFCLPVGAKDVLIVRADQFHPHGLPPYTLMPNMDVACSDQILAVRYWEAQPGHSLESGIRAVDLQGRTFKDSLRFSEEQLLSMPELIHSNEVLFSSRTRDAFTGLYLLGDRGQIKISVPKELESSRSLTSPKWWRGRYLVRRQLRSGNYQLWHGSEKIFDDMKDHLFLIHLPQVRGPQMVVKVTAGVPGDVNSKRGSAVYSFFGGKRVIVSDRQWDNKSEFLSVDNSPQPTGDGGLVFIGRHADMGRSVWYQTPSGERHLVAREKEHVNKIEYFAPHGNAHGEVVFRAIGRQGLRRVFYWNLASKVLQSKMHQGQSVYLNDGPARVIHREGWPAFSGRPCLTDTGKIFVHAVLESTTGGQNKGSGIFLIERD